MSPSGASAPDRGAGVVPRFEIPLPSLNRLVPDVVVFRDGFVTEARRMGVEEPNEPSKGEAAYDLPRLTMAEARRLMAGDFGERLHRLATTYMTWLAFGKAGPNGKIIEMQNGTCFFLQTPHRLFGVTARHVLDALKQARKCDLNTYCQIGTLPFNPLDRTISEGTNADIATFHISWEELEQVGKKPISLWPPHPPDVDDIGVLLAGYPAAAGVAVDDRTHCFSIYTASSILLPELPNCFRSCPACDGLAADLPRRVGKRARN